MKFNVSSLANAVSRNTGRMMLKVQKASPEIGMVIGTVAIIGGVIGACRATTKLSEVTADVDNEIDRIHDAIENPDKLELREGEEYTEQDAKHDLFVCYRKKAALMIKLYALPALGLALGLGCFYGSHRVLTKRNAALAAAYASIDKSFKQYRTRVVERFGKEMDNELRYNIKSEQFEKTVTDAKGKEKVVKENVEVVSDDPNTYSEFSRFFDSSCREWENDAEYNLTFLKGIQARANDLLKSKGFLFLNDVYKMLGIPETKAGQIVGWTYDKDTCQSKIIDEVTGEPVGDGYVSFGIFESHRRKNRDFVNGYEPVILLDFNVEGNVLDLI